MRWPALSDAPRHTLQTLAIGGIGALLFWAISAPVYLLIGPAVAVSVAGLAGLRVAVAPLLRDACFVILGLAVGAGFDADALGAMLRWPLAFVFMAGVIWAIMVCCRSLLTRGFGFDAHSALLASAPGHLSFVVALASETGADLARISITQSVRLLTLTIAVPFVALALGVELTGNIAPVGDAMPVAGIALLVLLSLGVGRIYKHFAVPAPLLLGAMSTSALAQLGGATTGVLPEWLILPAYMVLGALIGTRFAGVKSAEFSSGLLAGAAITGIAVLLSGIGALPVARALDMPLAHVLVAFAPGGLETMIAMGAVLGVTPGFVAACHIARLLVLSLLLPAMLARAAKAAAGARPD